MVNISCLEGRNLITDKYSSPMPVIGLYIAFGSLVCFLCMVFDMWYGFRREKIWLPCKLFSLNSFSLTIAAIGTKLSADLNTPMPLAIEQLSKLSSNVLLVISMGYFMPSLGVMRPAERMSNWIALSIMVITIVVNICIQMATGVIFAFFVEHVLIMWCMLFLLGIHGTSYILFNYLNYIYSHEYRNVAENPPDEWGFNSMRTQLRKLYAYTYSCNPEFTFCETRECGLVSLHCVGAVIVLLEAAIRSFVLRKKISCDSISDYKFSIWFIVASQMLTIAAGGFAICFRGLIVINHCNLQRASNWKDTLNFKVAYDGEVVTMMILPLGGSSRIGRCAKKISMVVYMGTKKLGAAAGQLILFCCLLIRKLCALLIPARRSGSTSNKDWMDVKDVVGSFLNDGELNEWKSKKAMNNMKRRMSEVTKKNPLTHLKQYLSKTFPTSPTQSKSILGGFQQRAQTSDPRYRASCLSVVILARIAAFSVRASVDCSLSEFIDLLSFIDQKMNAKNSVDNAKLTAAKKLWEGRRMVDWWVQKKIIERIPNSAGDDLGRALWIIKETHDLVSDFYSKVDGEESRTSIVEIKAVCNAILASSPQSFTQLSQHLEQTYQEMMRFFLTNLPRAIFKDYYESPVEECEERVERAVEFFSKLEMLGDGVEWSWPNETDIGRRGRRGDADAPSIPSTSVSIPSTSVATPHY